MAAESEMRNPQSAFRNPKWIDLHTHSTFSDGASTPAALVAEARAAGLAAIALTDHDTCDGLAEFLAAGQEQGVETLAGVEVSVEYNARTVHMLGYGIRPGDEHFRAVLRKLVEGRNERNVQMIRKLQLLGIRIDLEEVKAFATEQIVGRPHVAQILIQKRVVRTFEEAFDRYLGRGRPAYCERFRFTPEETIRLIAGAGGLSVLAHPQYICASPDALAALLARLKQAGLAGIEAYYTDHTDEQIRLYLAMAERFGLLATGGTDYHGVIKPGVALGWGQGSLRIPYALLERLREALEAVQSKQPG
jgi:hypothetical protein